MCVNSLCVRLNSACKQFVCETKQRVNSLCVRLSSVCKQFVSEIEQCM